MEVDADNGVYPDRSLITRMADVPHLPLPDAAFIAGMPAPRPGLLRDERVGEVHGDGSFHVVDMGAALPELVE